ncbi:hypothetical protein C4569_00920 [Candidatus Parcubacteria bacterium]|nr:MAG: hypothetical protein C4569_00920 [Candidatus Parcubacteria bacterium]
MKKNQLITAAVLIIAVFAAILFYYLYSGKKDEQQKIDYKDLLIFEIKNKNIASDMQAKYRDQFEGLKMAVEQNPDDFNSWLALGSLHKFAGNYELAEKTWIYAGQIRPYNSPSFSNLGDLYANFLNDYPKAESNYKTAIANSEGEGFNVHYSRQLFELYFYSWKEKKTEAESFLLGRIGRYPENPDFLVLLAYYFKDSGETEKALEYYNKAYDLNPDEAIKTEIDRLK